MFAISLGVYLRNMETSSRINDFRIFGTWINPFHLISFIINLTIILIFIIYLFQIKNKIIYFSVLSLVIGLNVLTFTILNFLTEFFIWPPSNDISPSSTIINNTLLLIIPIGLIVLSVYFRDKYRKSLI